MKYATFVIERYTRGALTKRVTMTYPKGGKAGVLKDAREWCAAVPLGLADDSIVVVNAKERGPGMPYEPVAAFVQDHVHGRIRRV